MAVRHDEGYGIGRACENPCPAGTHHERWGIATMEIDKDKIDDAILALLFLYSTGTDDHGRTSIGMR